MEILEEESLQLTVIPSDGRPEGGDLVLAELPRSAIDGLLERLPERDDIEGLFMAVEASEQLYPPRPDDDGDDDAVIWAQVARDVNDSGRLSWINASLIVLSAAIAAIGIIQDQLLLLVGAMAMSPDYYPIADTCLSIMNRNWHRMIRGVRTLAVSFGAAAVGAFLLTELLWQLGVIAPDSVPNRELTLFISRPDALSVVVAILAGIAGALAITLPQARGLVGVFVSVTTIPAAANMGVALANGDHTELLGATVQLVVNIVSLIVAGTATLELRRYIRPRIG